MCSEEISLFLCYETSYVLCDITYNLTFFLFLFEKKLNIYLDLYIKQTTKYKTWKKSIFWQIKVY